MGRHVRWSINGRARALGATLAFSAVLGATGFGAAGLGATADAGTATTGSVLQTTRTAIGKQAGAHVEFMARSGSSPSNTESIVADVGTVSGSETLTEGKASLTVKLTPTFGYVHGNSSGLTTVFGLSAAQAKKAGSDWISWKAGTSLYTSLKSDVTLASVTALLPKAKGTTLSQSDSRHYQLSWQSAATSTVPKLSNSLTVNSSGSLLPTKESTTAADGTKATTTISKWGEHVAVTAPPASSTVAYTKIGS